MKNDLKKMKNGIWPPKKWKWKTTSILRQSYWADLTTITSKTNGFDTIEIDLVNYADNLTLPISKKLAFIQIAAQDIEVVVYFQDFWFLLHLSYKTPVFLRRTILLFNFHTFCILSLRFVRQCFAQFIDNTSSITGTLITLVVSLEQFTKHFLTFVPHSSSDIFPSGSVL